MNVTTVGADLAKDIITVYAADAAGRVVEVRDLRRKDFSAWLIQLPKDCVVGMEACSGAHHWARQQIARNVTMEGWGALQDCRYLLHDRDTKYTQSFRAIIESGQVKTLAIPARSPNLNAYAERWVRSVKEECLSKLILFGQRSLMRALTEYVEHFHAERNHQGKGNVLLFPHAIETRREDPVQCRERLGGLLRYYHREAA